MKIMNKCDVDNEVRRPSHIQALNLQIPASLAAAGRNTAAAVGAKARGVCDVSDGREEELGVGGRCEGAAEGMNRSFREFVQEVERERENSLLTERQGCD